MDQISHKLFSSILLETVGKNSNYQSWGLSPDIDSDFLHRWYRHRFSTVSDTYRDGFSRYQVIPEGEDTRGMVIRDFEEKYKIDKDAIALCITSHLYLDMFNGWIFPFGIFHPIYPSKTVISEILDDINNPRLLVEELRKLATVDNFSHKFYEESESVMRKFVEKMKGLTTEELAGVLIYRMADYSSASWSAIYNMREKALYDIYRFTENDDYINVPVRPKHWRTNCDLFEKEYAELVNYRPTAISFS